MCWRITYNAEFRARVLALNAEAVSFGQDVAFRAALKDLIERVQTDPLTLGEPLHHLTDGEPVRKAVQAPVSITYAVYEAEGLVWLTRIDRLASPNE